MEPVCHRSSLILESRTHAVIGVSPFNSYFSQERLTQLFKWADANFEAFHIFVPDEATRFTFEALGYVPANARKKARRQARYLLNKIERALTAGSGHSTGSSVLTNEVLDANDVYRALLKRIETRYLEDTWFREQCLKASHWVLANRPSAPATGRSISKDSLHHAVKYFLAEMPLFIGSPQIVGVSSSTFCYHQCPDVLRTFYVSRPPGLISDKQGFAVVDEAALAPFGHK